MGAGGSSPNRRPLRLSMEIRIVGTGPRKGFRGSGMQARRRASDYSRRVGSSVSQSVSHLLAPRPVPYIRRAVPLLMPHDVITTRTLRTTHDLLPADAARGRCPTCVPDWRLMDAPDVWEPWANIPRCQRRAPAAAMHAGAGLGKVRMRPAISSNEFRNHAAIHSPEALSGASS